MICEFHFRSMTVTDLDAVVALAEASNGVPGWSHAEYRRCLDQTSDSALRRVALVAEFGASVAAFAVLRLLTVADSIEAELESIVVAADFRRRGIGAALLKEVLLSSKLHRADWIDLEVRASNAAALSLYRKAGWVECARRSGYYRDPEEDAVLMRVNL